MKITVLGWGSLLWDKRPEFDEQHDAWQSDGPYLKIEFSRVSSTRNGALTLVLDTKNGKEKEKKEGTKQFDSGSCTFLRPCTHSNKHRDNP